MSYLYALLLGLALAIQLAKKRSGKYGPLSGQAA